MNGPKLSLNVIVKRIIEAGYYQTNEDYPGSQMYDSEWYAPRFGCDSLSHCMDELISILTGVDA